MRVGIDIQSLRMERRGIYYYIWNILEQMCRQDPPCRIDLCLYGQPWVDDPEEVRRWAEAFPGSEVSYYWEGAPLRLLSHCWGGTPARAPRLARQIDRRFLGPLWQKMAQDRSGPQLWLPHSAPLQVDVLHHTAGLLFPLEGHANVITLFDLIPFHSPAYCQGATDMFGDGFVHAHRMDLIITVSEFTRRDIIQSLGVDADKVRVIPLAFHEQFRVIQDRDQVRATLAKYGMDGRPYIIHLGNMEARKNIHRLLEAFQRVKQAGDAPAHELVLVGEGAILGEVKQKIDELGLGADTRCTGFIPLPDVPALLNGADLFMYPSLYEGFGLPAIEAMACGTPVAAANATSLPEVVGDAGLLFDPLNVDEMAAVMRRALSEPGLRQSMRARGLARAAEFSWGRTAQLHMAAYAEAWDHFQRNRRRPTGRPVRSRYRQVVHDWIVAQSTAYTHEGTRINTWPF